MTTGYWNDLVSVALLGTDRRPPPAAPPGPLADLHADRPLASDSLRMLQQVAAVVATHRAGVTPAAGVALLDAVDDDPRPVTPAPCSTTWRRVIGDWPVLEDEWTLTVIASGHRLAPDLVVPVLARHRGDGLRHARAMVAGGALARWVVAHEPHLACANQRRVPAEQLGELPELAIGQDLLAASPTDLADALSTGALGVAHRAVLVNLVARVAMPRLAPMAGAFDSVDPSRPTIGIAFALADMCRLRLHMLNELDRS